MFVKQLSPRIFFAPDGDGGTGGSDPGGADPKPAEPTGGPAIDVESEAFKSAVKEAVSTQIETAVESVKATNTNLKNEKDKAQSKATELSKTFEDLGGQEGLEQLMAFKKTLEQDEVGKLLAEGKHEEWYDRKTEVLRADHGNQVEALNTRITELEGVADTSVKKLQGMVLKTEVLTACKDLGVVPEAVEDVQLRAGSVFAYDPDSKVETVIMRDSEGAVIFGKDAQTPKKLSEWLEDQKETSRHWWPASQGGGSGGSDSQEGGDGGSVNLEGLSQKDYEKSRTSQESEKMLASERF